MTPSRKKQIGQTTVEEYYWNKRRVVYVNNHKVEYGFEDVCKFVEAIQKPKGGNFS